MLQSTVPAEQALQLGWTDALVRHRRAVFVGLFLLYIFSFNGIWRVGMDSALYRGLGHSLAIGEGYQFNGKPHDHAYPGLPLIFAGLERLFGVTPVPALVLSTILACVAVVLTYRLTATSYPKWVAVLVTLGVGLNARFVQLSQEMLTDMPFFVAVLAVMLMFEKLRDAEGSWKRAAIVFTILLGLVAAALLRPVFWAFAGAWVLAFLWIAVRTSSRANRFGVIGLGAVLGSFVLIVVIDSVAGFAGWINGLYVREIAHRATEPSGVLIDGDILRGQDINEAFFAQSMSPGAPIWSGLLMAGVVLVALRRPVWAAPFFALFAATLAASSDPRYYLPVMPLLWLGFILVLARITVRCPPKVQGYVLALPVLAVIGLNMGRNVNFLIEQKTADLASLRGQDREAAFYTVYSNGSTPLIDRMAKLILENTGPDDRVIAPGCRIIAYKTGRHVVGQMELFDSVPITQIPAELAKHQDYLIVGPGTHFKQNDPLIHRLWLRGVIVTEQIIARDGELYIASFSVRPVDGDWRELDIRRK